MLSGAWQQNLDREEEYDQQRYVFLYFVCCYKQAAFIQVYTLTNLESIYKVTLQLFVCMLVEP